MRYRQPAWMKGKTHKRAYRGSRRFDKSCRCHGGCPWCERARLFGYKKRKWWADYEIKMFEMGEL